MQTGNDMGGNEFAQLRHGLRAGVKRGRNCGYVALHSHSDIGCADLFFAHQRHVGRLQHRVRHFQDGGKSLGFEDAKGCLFCAHDLIFGLRKISRQKLIAPAIKRVLRVREMNQVLVGSENLVIQRNR